MIEYCHKNSLNTSSWTHYYRW